MKVSIAYTSLLGSIVSSNVLFLVTVFEVLVTHLLPSNQLTMLQPTSHPHSHQHFIHEALRRVISLAPTGQSELFPILEKYYPHKRFPAATQTEYVTQLLRICEYQPSLQHRVLDLIVSRCLEMDVEIVIEESGDVSIQTEYEGDNPDDELFQLDEDQDGVFGSHNRSQQHPYNYGFINKNQSQGHNSRGNIMQIPVEVVEMAEKVSIIVCIFLIDFCFTQSTFKKYYYFNNSWMLC